MPSSFGGLFGFSFSRLVFFLLFVKELSYNCASDIIRNMLIIIHVSTEYIQCIKGFYIFVLLQHFFVSVFNLIIALTNLDELDERALVRGFISDPSLQ